MPVAHVRLEDTQAGVSEQESPHGGGRGDAARLSLPPTCPGSRCRSGPPCRCGPRAGPAPRAARTRGGSLLGGGWHPKQGTGCRWHGAAWPPFPGPHPCLCKTSRWPDWVASKGPAGPDGHCPCLAGQEIGPGAGPWRNTVRHLRGESRVDGPPWRGDWGAEHRRPGHRRAIRLPATLSAATSHGRTGCDTRLLSDTQSLS